MGAGEIIQWGRARRAFAEDLGLNPCPHLVSHTICNDSSHEVQCYLLVHTFKHSIDIKNKNKNRGREMSQWLRAPAILSKDPDSTQYI